MIAGMRFTATVSAALLLGACSRSAPPRQKDQPAESTTQSSAATSATSATLNGVVVGAGGAIVALESRGSQSFPPQSEPPVMDQIGATFSPDLLFVRAGQPVEFRNSDDTLHNVHVGNIDTKEPAFNVAIPTGEKFTYTFQKEGFYHVGCDIHPAMSAEIFASATPFATMAAADGRFSFVDVPPGPYTVRAFAGGERRQQEIEIGPGANQIRIR